MKTSWRSIFFKALEVHPAFAVKVIAWCAIFHIFSLRDGDTVEPAEEEVWRTAVWAAVASLLLLQCQTTLLQLFMSMTTIKEMCKSQNSFTQSHKLFGSSFIPCKWSYYFLFPFSHLSFQINLTAFARLALSSALSSSSSMASFCCF